MTEVRTPAGGLAVHIAIKEPAPLPAFFHPIHSGIGLAEKHLPAFCVLRIEADAYARPDRTDTSANVKRQRKGIHDSPRHDCRIRSVIDFCAYYYELIATHSRHGIFFSCGREQSLRNLPEQLVAGIMSECVVHVFEPVKIDIEDRQHKPVSPGQREELVEAVKKKGRGWAIQ